MRKANNLKDRMPAEIKFAQEKFEWYEKVYRSISGKGKKYLQIKSKEYKKIVHDFQELILPSIKKNCPGCDNFCCKLYNPDRSIYIAGSVGVLGLADYLLVRCDTVLPMPHFENMEKNFCSFWADGCILPPDCRSYRCIRWFCDKLKKELDMQIISKYREMLKSFIEDFSIPGCLGFNRPNGTVNGTEI